MWCVYICVYVRRCASERYCTWCAYAMWQYIRTWYLGEIHALPQIDEWCSDNRKHTNQISPYRQPTGFASKHWSRMQPCSCATPKMTHRTWWLPKTHKLDFATPLFLFFSLLPSSVVGSGCQTLIGVSYLFNFFLAEPWKLAPFFLATPYRSSLSKSAESEDFERLVFEVCASDEPLSENTHVPPRYAERVLNRSRAQLLNATDFSNNLFI